MATIQNLSAKHISAEMNTAANEAIIQLENVLAPVFVNLLPEERRRYGSVGEQNKLFVNKTFDYATEQPQLKSPDVDWEEFMQDFADRAKLESYISRLEKIIDALTNAKTLADFDNYQAALDDYAYTGYKVQTAAPGFTVKHKELKQFFSRTAKSADTTPPAAPETPIV